MIIRQETPAEFAQIYDLVKVAFETAKVSNGDEQNFVDQLRSGGNYLPELALVAEEDGRLIGHTSCSRRPAFTTATVGLKYSTWLRFRSSWSIATAASARR